MSQDLFEHTDPVRQFRYRLRFWLRDLGNLIGANVGQSCFKSAVDKPSTWAGQLTFFDAF